MVTQSSTAGRAGTITRAYRGPNNLSDWYLPSKDELAELNAHRTTVGGFSNVNYWSSSELDATTAWFQRIFSGAEGNAPKDWAYYVRPVRAFG
jgi:hypothetical protein